MVDFRPMPKTPRLSREIVVTEKIDGTNASVYIAPFWADPSELPPGHIALVQREEPLAIYAGSRTRWVTPGDDNYGFATWVREHAEELAALGPGHHFGEWWGRGINRGYDLKERRFSLFNVSRWQPVSRAEQPGLEPAPVCCHVVPILYRGPFDPLGWLDALGRLESFGSVAAPGFADPEGVMVYHSAANQLFKKTLKGDAEGKSAEAHPPRMPKLREPRAPADPNKLGRRKGCDGYQGPFRRKTDK